jgi:anti-sigma factor RsiW
VRRPDPHLPFEELAVGYALHALEPDEEQRFAAHLAACAACEREVAAHADSLAQLAHAAPPVEPPPALLEGIRAGIRSSAAKPVAARGPVGPPGPRAGEPPAVPVRAAVPELDAARRRRGSVSVRRSHLLAAAAAVVALLLGLGGWNAALLRQTDEQADLNGRLAATVRTLESDATSTVRLAEDDGDVLAVAVVQDDRMSLVVDGLPPNPDGTVYVLWGQSRYGDVRAVSTFDVDDDALDVLHDIPLEQGVGEVTTLMVTREPGRTAPAVTTQDVLVSGTV